MSEWIVAGVRQAFGPFASKAEAEDYADQIGYVYDWARIIEIAQPQPPEISHGLSVGDEVMIEWAAEWYGPGHVTAIDRAVIEVTASIWVSHWPVLGPNGPKPVRVHQHRVRALRLHQVLRQPG